jgi:predicted PurR-regulated permease PerM
MTSLEIAGLVAIILVSAFAIVAIIIAVPLFRLVNKSRYLVEKLGESLVPAVEDLKETIANLNTEVSSVVDLTQSLSSIVEQLEKIIRLARVLLTSPVIKIISTSAAFASGLKETVTKKNNEEDSNE